MNDFCFQFSSPKSKMIVFLSTQNCVEFHHRIFDDSINGKTTPAVDSGMDSDDSDAPVHPLKSSSSEKLVQFFKLHGDMQQKVRKHNFHGTFETYQYCIFICLLFFQEQWCWFVAILYM